MTQKQIQEGQDIMIDNIDEWQTHVEKKYLDDRKPVVDHDEKNRRNGEKTTEIAKSANTGDKNTRKK